MPASIFAQTSTSKGNMRFISFIFFIISLNAAEKNIIFIITDDQSPDLACYGNKIAVTPHLDAIAKDGTLFLNAFATTASCSASRSVVMSGLHNHKNGLYGHTHHYHKFDAYYDVISLSLPRVLANEGYRTIQIGKYHVAPEEVFRFDTYLKANPRNPVAMAKKCEAIIKEKSDKPFFIYFATSDPHRGGGKDQNFTGKLKPDLFGNLKDKGHYKGVKEVFYDPAKVPVPGFLPDTPESRSELAQYYQSCSRIDQGVGELVRILKEADLYDKTLIVFTADHGMAFAGAKTSVSEAGLKVPFIVRNPYEKKRGIVSKALLSHVDITSSLLDFAGGLDHKKNSPKKWQDPSVYWKDKDYVKKENRNGRQKFTKYQGKSWLNILAQEDSKEHHTIYASHTFHEIQMYYPMRVVRDHKYKLIWNIAWQLPYPFASDLWASSTWQAQLAKGQDAMYGPRTVRNFVQRPKFELYEIDKDPHESKNLASEPEYKDILLKYQEKLKEFQIKANDPWVMKWKYE